MINGSDETFNGWTNRETWAAVLHLMNNEGTYNGVLERVASSDDVYELASVLESYVDEIILDYGQHVPEVRMMRDEIGSLWRVNWVELAESYWKDYREDED